MLQLLTTFSTLFETPENPLGKTNVVEHSIHTSGPPIRQPLRRLPETLKTAVAKK